ncbi:hypothetical protein [Ewingella americana]|nr:hypothetical protein [Ewingella americana]
MAPELTAMIARTNNMTVSPISTLTGACNRLGAKVASERII